jgi:membrane protease YdiL (CAAX protease family)
MAYVWLLLVLLVLPGNPATAQTTVIAAAPTIIQANGSPITNVPDQSDEMDADTHPAESTTNNQTVVLVIWCALGALAMGLISWRRWDRLDHAPCRPMRVDPPVAFALIFGLFVMQFVGVFLAQILFDIDIASHRARTLDAQARLTVVVVFCQFLIIGVYAYLSLTPRPPIVTHVDDAVAPPARPPMSRGRAACIGALTLLITWPILAALGILAAMGVEAITGQPLDPLAHDTLREMVRTDDRAAFTAMAFLVVICTPVIEEVMYRGLLQDAFGRVIHRPWASIIITSIIFAAMHGGIASIHAIAVLFVFSLVLGWSYERTGRLTAPIVMHVLFNAANLAIAVVTA